VPTIARQSPPVDWLSFPVTAAAASLRFLPSFSLRDDSTFRTAFRRQNVSPQAASSRKQSSLCISLVLNDQPIQASTSPSAHFLHHLMRTDTKVASIQQGKVIPQLQPQFARKRGERLIYVQAKT
jgi:hypothetical protein